MYDHIQRKMQDYCYHSRAVILKKQGTITIFKLQFICPCTLGTLFRKIHVWLPFVTSHPSSEPVPQQVALEVTIIICLAHVVLNFWGKEIHQMRWRKCLVIYGQALKSLFLLYWPFFSLSNEGITSQNVPLNRKMWFPEERNEAFNGQKVFMLYRPSEI